MKIHALCDSQAAMQPPAESWSEACTEVRGMKLHGMFCGSKLTESLSRYPTTKDLVEDHKSVFKEGNSQLHSDIASSASCLSQSYLSAQK